MKIITRPGRVQRMLMLLGFSAATAQAMTLLLAVITVVCALFGAAAIAYVIGKGIERLTAMKHARDARMTNLLENMPASVQFFSISGGTEETNAEGELVLIMDDKEFEERVKGVRLWRIERCEDIGGEWVDTGNTWPGDEETMLDHCRKLYALELRLARPGKAAFFRGRVME